MLSGNICVEIVLESLTLASLYNSLNMVVIFELVVIFEPDSKRFFWGIFKNNIVLESHTPQQRDLDKYL